jgi:hypothetical protein
MHNTKDNIIQINEEGIWAFWCYVTEDRSPDTLELLRDMYPQWKFRLVEWWEQE